MPLLQPETWNETVETIHLPEKIDIAGKTIYKLPSWPRVADIVEMQRLRLISQENWTINDDGAYIQLPLILAYAIESQDELERIILDKKIKEEFEPLIEDGIYPQVTLSSYAFAEKYAGFLGGRVATSTETVEILSAIKGANMREKLSQIWSFFGGIGWAAIWNSGNSLRNIWTIQIFITSDVANEKEQKSVTVNTTSNEIYETNVIQGIFWSFLIIVSKKISIVQNKTVENIGEIYKKW